MELSSNGGMGNYDLPRAGVLPVFRKPCGCVLRLTNGDQGEQGVATDQETLTWTCVREEGDSESELKIPRVKLTGQVILSSYWSMSFNAVF